MWDRVIGIAIFLSAVFAAFTLPILPFLLMGKFRDRSRVKRFLNRSGGDILRINWTEGDNGCLVFFRQDGKTKRMEFRSVYARHLHVFVNDHQPTQLVFFCSDGSINVHELPSPDLVNGIWPHHCTQIKNTFTFSLLLAGAVYGFVFVTTALLFMSIDALSHYAIKDSEVVATIHSIAHTVGVLCLVTLPMVAAVWVYRRRRYESQIADAPILICRSCDYDLRGNVSPICPECGTMSLGIRRTTTPTKIPRRSN